MAFAGRSWYQQWGLVIAYYGDGERKLGPALAEFFDSIPITGSRTELCELMTAQRSDKGFGRHNYTLLYHFLFRGKRNDVKNLFEVGIGTNYTDTPSNMGTGGTPGASLRGWRNYFPNARIVGADIDRRVLFAEDRISTYYIDQTDAQTISELWQQLPNRQFDIIIDDGLHELAANASFMCNSFHMLEENGLYIIEDIIASRDNLKAFDRFFTEIGASGAVVKLPNPLNEWDNCLGIFVPGALSGEVRMRQSRSSRIVAAAKGRPAGMADTVRRAEEAARQGRWSDALSLWQSVSDAASENTAAALGKAEALAQMKRFSEADAVLAQAIDRAPGDERALLVFAKLAARSGNWPEALRRLHSCPPELKQTAGWLSTTGEALRELGRFGEADEVLAEGLSRFPEDYWLVVNYAKTAMHRHDWSEGLRRWEAVRGRFPNDAHAFMGCALASHELGRAEQAELLIAQALERGPSDYWVALHYARLAASARHWEEAVARWEKFGERYPGDPAGYIGRGEALRESGRFDEAAAVLEEGKKRLPNSEPIAEALVRLAVAQRSWPQALDRWNELSKGFPGPSLKAAHARCRLRGLVALTAPGADSHSLNIDRRLMGTVISEEPVIIFGTSRDEVTAFEILEETGKYYRERPVHILLVMAFSIAHPGARRSGYAERYRSFAEAHPNLRVTVLANDVKEWTALRQLGATAELVNHNAFLDESIFTIRDVPRTYDAVYTAQFAPYKRHHLAKDIDSLLLMFSHLDETTRSTLDAAKQLLPQAVIANQRPKGPRRLHEMEVAAALNSAKCGLCLSAAEGAMHGSIEYLFCGLPVVTTQNFGGRDWFFSNDYVIFCEDNSRAVREAVDRVIASQIPREFIRQNTLERVKRERLTFIALVDRILQEHGQGSRHFESEFPLRFFNKMYYGARPCLEFLVP